MDKQHFSAEALSSYLSNFQHSFVNYIPRTPRLSVTGLAGMIDHTSLKPEASENEIKILCQQALEYKFAAVCVNSSFTGLCSHMLSGSKVRVCSVAGFPLGASAPEVKIAEALYLLKNGATEIDMVINTGRLKSREYNSVYDEIQAISEAAAREGAICKVIIETCLLSDEEKVAACLLAKEAGANFVKTSTGFSRGGAEVRDVALMKYAVEGHLKVKASGGIKTAQDALAMISFGADRIGTSSGVKIIDEFMKMGQEAK